MFYSPIIKKVVKSLIFKDQTASKEFRKCFSTTIPYLQFLVSLVYCKSWNFIHIHTELLIRKTKYIPLPFCVLVSPIIPKMSRKIMHFFVFMFTFKNYKALQENKTLQYPEHYYVFPVFRQ